MLFSPTMLDLVRVTPCQTRYSNLKIFLHGYVSHFATLRDLVWVTPCPGGGSTLDPPFRSLLCSGVRPRWAPNVADPRICQHLSRNLSSRTRNCRRKVEVGSRNLVGSAVRGLQCCRWLRDGGDISGFRLGKHFPE